MLAYTYKEHGRFILEEKERPVLKDPKDAIVKVTLASICTSDLHIKHGSVPRAVPGITVGHEMVGIVEEAGSGVTKVKPGDRVTVNVETFAGNASSASTALSTTVRILTAAGLLAAASTAGRLSMCGFPTQTRGSTGSRTL